MRLLALVGRAMGRWRIMSGSVIQCHRPATTIQHQQSQVIGRGEQKPNWQCAKYTVQRQRQNTRYKYEVIGRGGKKPNWQCTKYTMSVCCYTFVRPFTSSKQSQTKKTSGNLQELCWVSGATDIVHSTLSLHSRYYSPWHANIQQDEAEHHGDTGSG